MKLPQKECTENFRDGRVSTSRVPTLFRISYQRTSHTAILLQRIKQGTLLARALNATTQVLPRIEHTFGREQSR